MYCYCCSIAKLCLIRCDSMDCNMPSLLVPQHLPEFTQTHVHWVGEAVQPCHPLSSPSPPAFNLSQHQGLFKWVSSATGGQSIGVSASVSLLPMNIQRWFPLGLTGLISCSPRDSQESSPTPQFKSINSSVFFIVQLSHPYMTTRKTIALTRWTFLGKVMSTDFRVAL